MGSFVGSKKRKGIFVVWQIICRLVKISRDEDAAQKSSKDEDESVDDEDADVIEDCRGLHT